MDSTYWYKQTDKPLFPDIVWSKPENRNHAGKLLIIGGNAHGFASVAEAYNASMSAGLGTGHVLLPNAIQSAVGPVLEGADFAPSTPSGSFGKQALGDMVREAAWADAVLLSGDMGRNSETAVVLESFASKYSGPLCITKDAADYFTTTPNTLHERQQTLLVISIAQLQRIAILLREPNPITFEMGLVQLVDWLHAFSLRHPIGIIVHHAGAYCVALAGKVSTTKSNLGTDDTWRVQTAAKATVWWLQNPQKPFEALTVSLV